MNNPNDHLDDKTDFFGFVHKRFLLNLPFLEKILLNPNLDDEIFQRAKNLGYVRKEAEKINKIITDEYLHESYHPIHVELPENDYCQTAVAQILQERIHNSEVFDEDIQFLADLLQEHDPDIPDSYLESIPNDIKIPEFDKDNWIEKIHCLLPEKFDNDEWIVLYSSKLIHLKDFNDEVKDYETISSAFVTTLENTDKFFKYDTSDFITTPIRHTLKDFKELPSLVKDMIDFNPVLIVKNNYWRFHSPNTLVRLDQKFMNENNLVWDNNSTLNLLLDGTTVVKYNLWAGPFDGNMHTRHRIGEGVRLLIKKDFLKQYLKKKKIFFIMLCETNRIIADPGINKTIIKKSKKLKDCKIYSSDDM